MNVQVIIDFAVDVSCKQADIPFHIADALPDFVPWIAPSIQDMRQPHFEVVAKASGLIPSRCE